jgi:hypothetical protein
VSDHGLRSAHVACVSIVEGVGRRFAGGKTRFTTAANGSPERPPR